MRVNAVDTGRRCTVSLQLPGERSSSIRTGVWLPAHNANRTAASPNVTALPPWPLLVGVAIAPGSDAHLELDERVDISGLVRDITCPALVIGAIEDRWVDVVHSRYLAADIQGARLMELPAGHLVIQEMARDLGPILHAHMVEADDSRIGDADGSAPR